MTAVRTVVRKRRKPEDFPHRRLVRLWVGVWWGSKETPGTRLEDLFSWVPVLLSAQPHLPSKPVCLSVLGRLQPKLQRAAVVKSPVKRKKTKRKSLFRFGALVVRRAWGVWKRN